METLFRSRPVVAAGRIALGVATAAGLEVATYPLWRQWCLNWGARPAEVEQALPGDDLLQTPDIQSTRAISIGAPPSLVWPWLVQMGPGRGGAYSYDWVENLFGLGMHSTHQVLPEFQGLKVGDTMNLGPRGPVLRVAILDAQRALVVRSDDGNWVWAFALVPFTGRTRLISRNRIAGPLAVRARLLTAYVMEPGSLIMERKMLLGIKQRAEHLAVSLAASRRAAPDRPRSWLTP
jgi:hypothetical protein